MLSIAGFVWLWVAVLGANAVVSAICGYFAAEPRGAGGKGATLGFCFGALGVLAALVIDGRPRCGECGGRLEGLGYRRCPNCGHERIRRPAALEPRSDPLRDAAEERGFEFLQETAGTEPGLAVRFHCPECGAKLKGKPGRETHCPNCGAAVRVPER